MLAPLKQNDPDFFEFDWRRLRVSEHAPGRSYTAGDIVRPKSPTGFYYEATHTATKLAGGRPPAWSSVLGATIVDGSCEWTVRAPDALTTPTISTVVYVLTPTGITQSSPSIDTDTARSMVRLDGGAANPGTYTLKATMTDSSGEEWELEEALEVVA